MEDPAIPSIAEAVGRAIGPGRVTVAPLERRALSRDMGEPPRLLRDLLGDTTPVLVVRPEDAAQLAAAMACLAEAGLPVTPRGLGSSGLGGAVPVAGGAVLDLSRLTGVTEVDEEGLTATVRAGTPFYHLDRRLALHGLALLSRPTNAFGTLGGWAAGGGIGLGSMGAGRVAQLVEAVSVVRPDGTAERLRASDEGFADLFETEGQLGVLADLTLRVCRRAPTTVSGWMFRDPTAAAEAFAALHALPVRPLSVLGADEERDGMALLVETAGHPPDSLPRGARLPSEEAAARWSRRYLPLDGRLGPLLLASEAVLPASAASGLGQRARRLARRHGVPLHVHLHGVGGSDTPTVLALMVFPADARQRWHHLLLTPLAAALTSLALRAGGRPYGIGLWNTPLAARVLGPDRFEALRRHKERLDPGGRLNPGKLFAFGARTGLLPLAMRPAPYSLAVGLAATTAPVFMRRHDPSGLPATTGERCISCGACVPVCPAVAATGAEAVSARAKLDLLSRLLHGEEIEKTARRASQRCLKCGQCAEVCARGLPLLDAWEELEVEVRRREDDSTALDAAIHDFTEAVDASRDGVLAAALP